MLTFEEYFVNKIVSSEGHAVVVQDEGDTARGVARAGPGLQGLAEKESTKSHQ